MSPLVSLLPLFSYFSIGLLLRATGALRSEHADVMFRVVFYVSLPALAFLTVSTANLTRESALLPAAGFLVDVAGVAIGWLYARSRRLSPRDTALVMLCAGITNGVFTFTFVLAVLGSTALAEAILFDLGNAFFVATVATGIVLRHGSAGQRSTARSLLKLLRTPLFVALFAGLLVNASGWQLPAPVTATLSPLGAVTVPLIVMALGTAFHLGGLAEALPLHAVLLRMLPGFLLGSAIVALFGFEGGTAAVLVAAAAAPIGFTAVTLSSIGKLDMERVSAAASLSVLAGMIMTPVILWLH